MLGGQKGAIRSTFRPHFSAFNSSTGHNNGHLHSYIVAVNLRVLLSRKFDDVRTPYPHIL
jgi:hypothetical protein